MGQDIGFGCGFGGNRKLVGADRGIAGRCHFHVRTSRTGDGFWRKGRIGILRQAADCKGHGLVKTGQGADDHGYGIANE